MNAWVKRWCIQGHLVQQANQEATEIKCDSGQERRPATNSKSFYRALALGKDVTEWKHSARALLNFLHKRTASQTDWKVGWSGSSHTHEISKYNVFSRWVTTSWLKLIIEINWQHKIKVDVLIIYTVYFLQAEFIYLTLFYMFHIPFNIRIK